MHNVLPGVGNVETNSDAPRNRICRNCATEVLVWGLKEWWVRERQKGFLEEEIMKRKDCPEGDKCEKQTDLGIALFHPFMKFLADPTPFIASCTVHARECKSWSSYALIFLI